MIQTKKKKRKQTSLAAILHVNSDNGRVISARKECLGATILREDRERAASAAAAVGVVRFFWNGTTSSHSGRPGREGMKKLQDLHQDLVHGRSWWDRVAPICAWCSCLQSTPCGGRRPGLIDYHGDAGTGIIWMVEVVVVGVRSRGGVQCPLP